MEKKCYRFRQQTQWRAAPCQKGKTKSANVLFNFRRGTRIEEEQNKFFFTIMDFKKATELFKDPDFDGEPVVIYEPGKGDDPVPPDPD